MTFDDIASRLADRLRTEFGPDVISAYVFGSQAEARAHRESDLDIGVLLNHAANPSARERFNRRVQLGSALSIEGMAPDVVILNDAPPGLARHVVTRGRRVYCTDELADHSFARDAQLRASDIEPFLRRMERIKLEGLGPR